MEEFKNEFTTTELLSYKEVLYYEATEDWYAKRDPDEVEREERNCTRLAQQFCLAMKDYRERLFTYVHSKLSTWSVATHLESYLLLVQYTSELDNLQLELDWITWQIDYALNKAWGDSRTSILETMHVNCKF